MKPFAASVITVLSVFVFASPAMASFSRSSCSNADGSVRYEFSMAWNEPMVTKWIIKQNVVNVDESLVEHSMRQILEQAESPMVHASTTVEKITLKKEANSNEIVFSTWWICSSAAGI
jgi:hypothetical protein